MKTLIKFPPVILAMYGFRLIPINKQLFEKNSYEKQKLKRIKAAHTQKMRQAGREHKGWNREYITFSNSLKPSKN